MKLSSQGSTKIYVKLLGTFLVAGLLQYLLFSNKNLRAEVIYSLKMSLANLTII